jgi:hypothetical protein
MTLSELNIFAQGKVSLMIVEESELTIIDSELPKGIFGVASLAASALGLATMDQTGSALTCSFFAVLNKESTSSHTFSITAVDAPTVKDMSRIAFGTF